MRYAPCQEIAAGHPEVPEVEFGNLDEANCIVQLVMCFYNQVVQQFTDDPEGLKPANG